MQKPGQCFSCPSIRTVQEEGTGVKKEVRDFPVQRDFHEEVRRSWVLTQGLKVKLPTSLCCRPHPRWLWEWPACSPVGSTDSPFQVCDSPLGSSFFKLPSGNVLQDSTVSSPSLALLSTHVPRPDSILPFALPLKKAAILSLIQ